uniref:Intron-encoded I-PpoI type endonuclease n=1 Tax=Neoscytalidium dimidiatum TaxID=108428 RepID=Q7Z9J1_9PEZI|nr:intron-encoded I-PpoI type endonuclease [Neoscytalidium dimidiatum]
MASPSQQQGSAERRKLLDTFQQSLLSLRELNHDQQHRLSSIQKQKVEKCLSDVYQTAQKVVSETLAKSQLEEASQSTVSRPTTSESLLNVREVFQQALADRAEDLDEVSASLEKLSRLPAGWCRAKLITFRNDNGGNTPTAYGELACWTSPDKQPSEPGKPYRKLNWRNTNHPNRPSEKIGHVFYAHHIGAVAAGYGNHLSLISGAHAAYNVSHLCGNGECFNPDHLVIETAGLNQRRKTCQGHAQVRLPNGSVYHPCQHGTEEHAKLCILPLRRAPLGRQFFGPGDLIR